MNPECIPYPTPHVADRPVPPLLYKYVQPERVDIIESCRISFTPPNNFNDPFEFKPYFKAAYTESDLTRKKITEAQLPLKAEQEFRKKNRGVPSAILNKRIYELRAFAAESAKKQMMHKEPRMRASFVRGIEENLHAKLGVLCLCEQWESILMWGHYTSSHSGLVIGFRTDHKFFDRKLSRPLKNALF